MREAWHDELPAWEREAYEAVGAAQESPQRAWATLAAQQLARPHSRPCAAATVEEAGDGEWRHSQWRAVLREVSGVGPDASLGAVIVDGGLWDSHQEATRAAVQLHADWWKDSDARGLVLEVGEDTEGWWRDAADVAHDVEEELRDVVGAADGERSGRRLFAVYEQDGDTGAEVVVGHNAAGPLAAPVIARFKADRAYGLDGEAVGWWLPPRSVMVRGALEAYSVWKHHAAARAEEFAAVVEKAVQAGMEADPGALHWLAGAAGGALEHEDVVELIGADVLEVENMPPAGLGEEQGSRLMWLAARPQKQLQEPYRCRVVVSALGAGQDQRSVRVEFSDPSGYVARARALRSGPALTQGAAEVSREAGSNATWWTKGTSEARDARRTAAVVVATARPEPELELGL